MSDKISINGVPKDVKFIEVYEDKKIVKIFFKDFTYTTINDIKIFIKNSDS